MALKIDLRDGEKVVVNGAVLCSSGRTRLYVENHVTILRGTGIMTPVEADTPARRLYFACMMAYLEPEQDVHRQAVLSLFTDILDAFEGPEAKAACGELATLMASSDFYRALGVCRELMHYEDGVLARLDKNAEYQFG
jgi:flagellar protein FlbT